MNPKLTDYSQSIPEDSSAKVPDEILSDKSMLMKLYSLYFQQYQETTKQAQIQQAIYLFFNLILALSMISVSAFHSMNSVVISSEILLFFIGTITVWAWHMSSKEFIHERESQFRILVKIEEELYGEGHFVSKWARAGEAPYRYSPIPLFGLRNFHVAFFGVHAAIVTASLLATNSIAP